MRSLLIQFSGQLFAPSISRVAIALGTTATLLLLPRASLARPEYAAQFGYAQCASCHWSPAGGGPRTSNDKLFGSQRGGAPRSAADDAFTGDARFVGLFPERTDTASSYGIAVMSLMAGASLPITSEGSKPETRLVASYHLGSQGSSGVQNAFLLFRFREPATTGVVQDVVFGRFHAPFGLATDEHRTYVRIQNKSAVFDFQQGLMVSGSLLDWWHHDLIFTVALPGGTGGFSSNSAATPGNINTGMGINLRATPPGWPLYLGSSYLRHQSALLSKSPQALSVFAGISLNKVLGGKVPGYFLFEAEWADGWNGNTAPADNSLHLSNFVNLSTLTTYFAGSQSLGLYSLLGWDFASTWSAFYKFDLLALDRRYFGDAFYRHGVGVKHYFAGHLSASIRYELAGSRRADLQALDGAYSRDSLLILVHAGI